MDTETNPGVDDVPEVEDVQDVEELGDGSTEDEDSDNPDEETEESEPETVDIERDGKTFKVPLELKDDFLRQSDYTRKTQEISAKSKELDAALQRVQQAGEAEVNAKAQMIAVDAAIAQYQNVDWNALEAQDPVAASRHWRQFSQLQTAKGEVANEYNEAVRAREIETQQEAAKRIEQGIAELQRDIPDWGPQRAEELLAFGEKQFGFSREYMDSITDPRLIKLMNYAHIAAKSSTKPKQVAPPLKPAAKVKGGSAPRKGLDDRLPADEWMKQRNAQLAKSR